MNQTIETALDFQQASQRIKKVVTKTPLSLNRSLSKKFQANVYLKREDLQVVRSYKLRGAYNLLSSLPNEQLQKGVVCASAGNHAQGFAFSCKMMNIKGVIFMPIITPKQKVTQTKMFGEDCVEVRLVGDTFDDCAIAAKEYTEANGKTFIPPFDHYKIIEGQGTVALEIFEELPQTDFVFVPHGGGGLASGVGLFFKQYSPNTRIVAVEPQGAASYSAALANNGPITLDHLDRFVDGAAVKRVGEITFNICKEVVDQVQTVPEGRICSTILKLYNEDALVVEPAGALSVSVLEDYADQIKGKNVVCIISGSNNDIDRLQEIKERSLRYEGLKHYFLIRFAQRPGALKDFLNKVLGPNDDITRFEYMQKHNKETGPALVGIELKDKNDYCHLVNNLKTYQINYTALNEDDDLFSYLV